MSSGLSQHLSRKHIWSWLTVGIFLVSAIFLLSCGFPVSLADVGPAPQLYLGLSRWGVWGPSYPNGVNAIAVDDANHVAYYGGNFTDVGKSVNNMAIVDASTGAEAAQVDAVPADDTYAVVPDGSGGWYVGGQYTGYSDLISGFNGNSDYPLLAHIDANGVIDTNFNPTTITGYGVDQLFLSGSTLYVQAENDSGYYIAALNAADGSPVESFTPPDVTGYDDIYAIAADGTHLFIGGDVDDGIVANGVLNVYTTDGSFTISYAVPGPVYTLAVGGSTLYAGGGDKNGDGSGYLLAFDTTSGEQVPGFESGVDLSAGPPVTLVADTENGTLYVGGSFDSSLAAVDADDGSLLSGLVPTVDGDVLSLSLDGTTVYGSGHISSATSADDSSSINDQVFAFSTADGVLTDFTPTTNYIDGMEHIAGSGGRVLMSGEFSLVNMIPRADVVAIDTQTDELLPALDFEPDDIVTSLALNGTTLYVGGHFTNQLEAFDTTTGDQISSDTFSAGSINGDVDALLFDGTTLYAGGNFGARIIGLDPTTGETTKRFDPLPTYQVDALALSGDGILYAGENGGSFTGGVAAYHTDIDNCPPDELGPLCASVDGFAPPVSDEVWSLATDGSTLYVGDRNGLHFLDAMSGAPTDISPTGYNFIHSLALNGTTLYAGSDSGLVGVDTATGDTTEFQPVVNDTVEALVLDGSTLYAGGHFPAVDDKARTRLAVFTATEETPTPTPTPTSTPTPSSTPTPTPSGSPTPTPESCGEAPRIWLKGSAFMTVQKGNTFTDPGAVVTSDDGVSLDIPVTTTSTVDTQTVGQYTVRYDATCGDDSAAEVVRTVDVVEPHGRTFLFDTGGTPGEAQDTGGAVFAITPEMNGTYYMGGEFSTIGLKYGGNVLWNFNSNDFASTPTVDGVVQAAIPDGVGGYYIGGTFTRVGGYRRAGLAHIRADHTVDPDFAPSLTPSGFSPGTVYVDSLALDGSTLYVGGIFSYGDVRSNVNLVAVDAATGDLIESFPDLGLGGASWVSALAVSGNQLYLGGVFNSADGEIRQGFAAVDKSTGALAPVDLGLDGSVYTILVHGSTLYVGGVFSSAGGQTRHGVAAFDVTPTSATLSDFTFGHLDNIYSLTLDGSTLYVGGGLLYAVDATTGDDIPSFVPVAGLVNIRSIGVLGEYLYIAAQPSFGGTLSVVKLDKSTGAQEPFDLGLSEFSTTAGADTIVVSPTELYVGGNFEIADSESCTNLIGKDAATGRATSFRPTLNKDVYALASDGKTLYVGTAATTVVNGQTRHGLAAFDEVTGTLTSFAPNINGKVRSMLLDGTTLYIAGEFDTVNGTTRQGTAALDVATGALLEFTADVGSGNYIATLALSPDRQTVYIGGSFNAVNGQSRAAIAAVDAVTGAVRDFDSGLRGNDNVWALAISADGGTLYAAGDIESSDHAPAPWQAVAAFDTLTGTEQPFDVVFDNNVNALAIEGTTLFVGGQFTSVNGNSDNPHFTAIDTQTDEVTPIDTGISKVVNTILLDVRALQVGAGQIVG